MDAIGFAWSDPYRWLRIAEVLDSGRRFSIVDMMRLQTDELSIPARELVPLLEHVRVGRSDRDGPDSRGDAARTAASDRTGAVHRTGAGDRDARIAEARRLLLGWDHVMDDRSIPAGIYAAWETELRRGVRDALVPPDAGMGLSLSKVIETLRVPPGTLGDDPIAARDALLLAALERAVAALEAKLGPDMSRWHYGQPDYHHAYIRHPLGDAVDADTRSRLEVGPAPRGGYGYTVNQTGNGDNQTSGASFRIIVDTGDWDRAVGMNSPGQSGDVRSPFYDNLFDLWAADRFHPVFFSRDRIEEVTARRIELRP
jgi:penicillin amidase